MLRTLYNKVYTHIHCDALAVRKRARAHATDLRPSSVLIARRPNAPRMHARVLHIRARTFASFTASVRAHTTTGGYTRLRARRTRWLRVVGWAIRFIVSQPRIPFAVRRFMCAPKCMRLAKWRWPCVCLCMVMLPVHVRGSNLYYMAGHQSKNLLSARTRALRPAPSTNEWVRAICNVAHVRRLVLMVARRPNGKSPLDLRASVRRLPHAHVCSRIGIENVSRPARTRLMDKSSKSDLSVI